MLIQTEKMLLKSIREVNKSEDAEVYICENVAISAKTCYTIAIVKNHVIARQLIHLFEMNPRKSDSFVDSFLYDNNFCFLFDYVKERPLEDFYMGKSFSLHRCESICINLVLTCLSSALPYPVIYMLLTQGQTNLATDDSVYFTFNFDLTEFDDSKTEADCALECARIVKKLLGEHEEEKAISYNLIARRINREGYLKFSEVYKDIRLTSVEEGKKGILASIKRFIRKHSDGINRVIITLCIFVMVVALISFLSQKFGGENIFARLFTDTFEIIGTESMLQ